MFGKLMRSCLLLVLLLAGLSGAWAKGAQEGSKEPFRLVTSRWAGPHADFQAEVLKKFVAETGIQAKQDAIDYGQLFQKQTLNMSSKTGEYDLVWVAEVWLPGYVKSGYLRPLNEYFGSTAGFDLNSYNPSMLKINTINGKVYALPTFAQCAIVAYNKKMLADAGLQPPQTWADTLKVAKYFKDQGTGIALPAKQGMAAVDVWAGLAYSNDGGYFDKNGKLAMTSPENLQTMKFWKTLVQYSMEGSTNWHWDEVNKAIQFGQAPIGITISGLAGFLEDPASSKVAGNVGFLPLPYNKQVATILSFWSWAVTADSKHPAEAFQLAAWLTSAKVEKEQSIANGQISAVASLFNDKDLVAKYSFLPAVGLALANAHTQPLDENAPKLAESMMVALSSAAVGAATPEAALEQVQKEIAPLY